MPRRNPTGWLFIQEACRWVEQTPWSLGSTALDADAVAEPRLRILIAEVQARCAASFAATDATPHEEKLTRQNARLQAAACCRAASRNRNDRFVQALADSDPAISPEEWAARAALTWCADPGVTGARVAWVETALQLCREE